MNVRRRSWLFMLLCLGLAAGSIAVIAMKPTVLGLDLQGGSQAILEGRDTAEAKVTPESLKRAVNVIRDRIDKFGVSEAEIQTQGSRQISVSVPNVDDPKIIEDLVKAAQLTLYAYEPNLVGREPGQASAPNNPTTDLYGLIQTAKATPVEGNTGSGPNYYLFRKNDAHTYIAGPQLSREDLIERLRLTDPELAAQYDKNPKAFDIQVLPKGFVILTDGERAADINDVTLCGQGGTCVLLRDRVGLTGGDLKGANLGFDSLNNPTVQMQFTGAGRDKFADVTKEIARGAAVERRPGSVEDSSWHFAIGLDGVMISNPYVDYQQYPTGIDSDNAEISGGFSESSARTLADQLSSGAVPIRLDTVSLQTVSATLGEQSLRQGLIAGLIGLVLVMVALIAYYRVLGVLASASLILYALYFWAIAKLVPIALTLPGIAGLILTIGVAADASVVIFERVREEARAGRPPRTALLNGYKRGITAIIDANIVTLVTAVFIFLLASAGPRGFAFTLIIGVLLSLFTAIIFTQGAFGLLMGTKLFQNERLMGFNAREIKWKMDVVGRWKFWMAISFVPLLLGVVYIGFNGLKPGLDFTSGTRVSVAFTQEQPSENALRELITGQGIADPTIQEFTRQGASGGDVQGFEIRTKPLTTQQTDALLASMEDRFGPIDQGIEQIETIGPTFGRDIVRNAVWAIVFSFLAIIAYLTLRFEYKLALPALVSVIHDVWLVLAIYSIAGKEVTGATVAALLTILGYSLYDVVILFDRIRENLPLMRGRPYRDVVNRSVHETLTRSIITMLLTLLPIISLLAFGGETLNDFAFALLVGILSGGISSIFISAPLAALWKEREPDARKAAARQARKAERAAAVDADIMDVSAFNRAEAAIETPGVAAIEPEATDLSPNGQPDLAPEVDAVSVATVEDVPGEQPSADEPVPDAAATDTAAPETAPPPPERERRHRNVQRKRRR